MKLKEGDPNPAFMQEFDFGDTPIAVMPLQGSQFPLTHHYCVLFKVPPDDMAAYGTDIRAVPVPAGADTWSTVLDQVWKHGDPAEAFSTQNQVAAAAEHMGRCFRDAQECLEWMRINGRSLGERLQELGVHPNRTH